MQALTAAGSYSVRAPGRHFRLSVKAELLGAALGMTLFAYSALLQVHCVLAAALPNCTRVGVT